MSRPVPRNDVEIEGRFVLLELGPHEQTKRPKKEFSVGKRRWYCRCSYLPLCSFFNKALVADGFSVGNFFFLSKCS